MTRIAVARDAAFNFYYQENLELLEQMGAELLFFSPLAGEHCPEQADGLYIGGGFPEEFAEQLSSQHQAREALKRRIEEGMPTLAECGGYMYLCKSIADRKGQIFEMVGVIPCEVRMQDQLAAIGYREVRAATDHFLLRSGDLARGHEFHYSTATPVAEFASAFESRGFFGSKQDGYSEKHIVAGYTHLYFPSNLEVPRKFVAAAEQYRRSKSTHHQ